jgi:hypothetical protein
MSNLASPRLLLRDAVKRAAFLDEVEAVDGDDFSVGKLLGDDAEGTVVVFPLAEGGDEDGVVEDEEIYVGGGKDREAPAGDLAGLWEVDGNHFERFAGGGLEVPEAMEVIGEWLVIG